MKDKKLLNILSMSSAKAKETKGKTVVLHSRTDKKQKTMALQRNFNITFACGNDRVCTRKLRLLLPKSCVKLCPVILSVHYELPTEDGCVYDYISHGIAVLTPYDIPMSDLNNIVGDDLNFTMAMLAKARRISEIDSGKIGIRGASAGGYQALMLCGLSLGICAAYSMSGVANLGYNLGRYIPFADKANAETEAKLLGKDKYDIMKYPLPFVKSVALTFEQTCEALGKENPESIKWINFSPVTYAECFSCPVIFSHSTADTIVPIYQISEKNAYKNHGSTLPAEFPMHLSQLMTKSELITPLDELLPEIDMAQFRHPIPKENDATVLRFNSDKKYNFNFIDEGEPEATCSHYKYPFAALIDDTAFWTDAFSHTAKESNFLTEEKLKLLSSRYAGTMPLLIKEKATDFDKTPSVFGSIDSDRLDVLLEICAFAGIDIAHLDENKPTHEQCLSIRKQFDDVLSQETAFCGEDDFITSLCRAVSYYAQRCNETEILKYAQKSLTVLR